MHYLPWASTTHSTTNSIRLMTCYDSNLDISMKIIFYAFCTFNFFLGKLIYILKKRERNGTKQDFPRVKATNVAKFSHIASHWLLIADWCCEQVFYYIPERCEKRLQVHQGLIQKKSLQVDYWAINSFFFVLYGNMCSLSSWFVRERLKKYPWRLQTGTES